MEAVYLYTAEIGDITWGGVIRSLGNKFGRWCQNTKFDGRYIGSFIDYFIKKMAYRWQWERGIDSQQFLFLLEAPFFSAFFAAPGLAIVADFFLCIMNKAHISYHLFRYKYR